MGRASSVRVKDARQRQHAREGVRDVEEARAVEHARVVALHRPVRQRLTPASVTRSYIVLLGV